MDCTVRVGQLWIRDRYDMVESFKQLVEVISTYIANGDDNYYHARMTFNRLLNRRERGVWPKDLPENVPMNPVDLIDLCKRMDTEVDNEYVRS